MPNHHNACNNMGAALRAKGELQAAIKSYDSAIKINPKNVDARYNKPADSTRQRNLIDVSLV